MRCEYTLFMLGRCPVGEGCPDPYRVTVRACRELRVEEILAACADLTKAPATQEEITEALHRRLGAEVETAGVHSGVLARVVCGVGFAWGA